MASLIHPKLGLDCRFSPKPYVQKPIGRFLADVSMINSMPDEILKLDDYISRLQDEMKKIDAAFKRELPLSMHLLSKEIVAMQDQLAQRTKLNPEPVLKEFMPLKTNSTNEKDEDSKENVISRDKKNWMSSEQLFNADDQNSNSNTHHSNNKSSSNTDTDRGKKRMGEEINQPVMDELFHNEKKRAFLPFKGPSSIPVMKKDMDEFPVAGLSLCIPGTDNSREVMTHVGSSYARSVCSSATSNLQTNFKSGQLQTGRKQRRCWSPELHRQFINALHHLGGPQAATPKQIREHMQVDGLTNDEVKSHLQKFRIHMQRVSNTSTTSQEQFVGSLKQSSGKSDTPQSLLHSSRCLDVDGETPEDEYND